MNSSLQQPSSISPPPPGSKSPQHIFIQPFSFRTTHIAMCSNHRAARRSCGHFHDHGLGHHHHHHDRHHYHRHHQHSQLISGLLFGLAATARKTLEHHQQQQSAPVTLQQHDSCTPRTDQTAQEEGITNAHPSQTAAKEPGLEAPPAYDDAIGNEEKQRQGQVPFRNEKDDDAPATRMRGGWLAPTDVEPLSRGFGEMDLNGRQAPSLAPVAASDNGTERTGCRRSCGYGAGVQPRWAEKLRRKEEKVVAKLERKADKYARKLQKAAEKAERKGF
jgi:hypothetical protein